LFNFALIMPNSVPEQTEEVLNWATYL
jgi:hypothetical protein